MKKKIYNFSVKNNEKLRCDIFLSLKLKNYSRTQIKKFILEGFVKINKITVLEPAAKVYKEDTISINIPPPIESHLEESLINLDIIYEDSDIIIINKPSGLIMHPGAGNAKNTLVNGLVKKFKKNLSSIGGKLRPGIVHRLDKDTSGVIVVAKNDRSHLKLSDQFSKHTIKRKYEAIVWGVLRPLTGKISTKIARSNKNRQLMSVSNTRGKIAITNYKTLKIFTHKKIPILSLIECQLETGRTHQIRVHMSFKGNSIIGDKAYGKIKKFKSIHPKLNEKLKNFNRQALHAKSLGFIHPSTLKNVFYEVARPEDFENLLKMLKKYSF